jgi:hypothetical protein
MSTLTSAAPLSTTNDGARRAQPLAPRALGHVLTIAAVFVSVVAAIVLIGFDGWEYYRAPVGERGYMPAHRLLRPSGPVGLTLGLLGAVAMLSTLPYAIRKRSRLLSRLGTTKGWLEVHIFFGVVGPLLITFHTSFKFNGLISAGYWLMMAVWASGFVGRYLYVRIPKSIRGTELTRDEIERRLQDVRTQLQSTPMPPAALHEIDVFAAAVTPKAGSVPGIVDLCLGELRVRVRLALLARHLRAMAIDADALHAAVALVSERAAIARRLAHLQRTKQLFQLWHVFHQPLVYAMFAIVALHIGVAFYLGYARLVS